MVVCKYFAEGRCRFGARCYYDHIADNRYKYGDEFDSRSSHHSPNRSFKQDENYAKENRYDRNDYNHGYNQSRNQSQYTWRAADSTYAHQSSRYDSSSSFQNVSENQGFSPRYGSPTSQSPLRQRIENNQNLYSQYDSYDSAPSSPQNFRDNQRSRYDSSRSPSPSYPGFESNQSRYSWHNSSYSGQPSSPSSESNSSKSSAFRFSKNKFDALDESNYEKENTPEQNDLIDIVKEDMLSWEEGHQWPFSCYLPFKSCPQFPDFNDISPEELRYEAYEAEKNDSFPTYVKSVSDAMNTMKQKRSQLRNPTPEITQLIMHISKQKKSDLSNNQDFSNGNFATFNKDQTSNFSFGKPSSTLGLSDSSGFSFRHLTSGAPGNNSEAQMSENSKPAASESVFRFAVSQKAKDFSFKLSGAENSKAPSKTESNIYTPLEDLTAEEREAFEAPVFVLGKIPTRPPPKELCF